MKWREIEIRLELNLSELQVSLREVVAESGTSLDSSACKIFEAVQMKGRSKEEQECKVESFTYKRTGLEVLPSKSVMKRRKGGLE